MTTVAPSDLNINLDVLRARVSLVRRNFDARRPVHMQHLPHSPQQARKRVEAALADMVGSGVTRLVGATAAMVVSNVFL